MEPLKPSTSDTSGISPAEARARLQALRTEARGIQEQIRQLRLRVALLGRDAATRVNGAATSGDELQQLQSQLIARQGRLKEVLDASQRLRESFFSPPSGSNDASLPNDHPILLAPVRLETRFIRAPGAAATYSLLIRLYPDPLTINSHNPELNRSEVALTRDYRSIVSDPDSVNTDKEAAWRELARKFGEPRARWLARKVGDYDGRDLADIPDHTRTDPAKARLPDYFVVRLYREGKMVNEVRGTTIPDELALPFNPSATSSDEVLRGGAAWVHDFAAARKVGMAVAFDNISADEADAGYDEVVAVGVKWSSDAAQSKQELEALCESHLYTRGFSFVEDGEPTNNTEDGRVAAQTVGPAPWAQTPPLDANSNAARLSSAIGIGGDILGGAGNATDARSAYSQSMQQALWPATWGYFLSFLLKEKELGILDQAQLLWLWDHYRLFVRARGALPVVRIGELPYGVIPVTSLGGWKPSVRDAVAISDPIGPTEGGSAPDGQAYQVLVALSELWLSLATNPGLVPRIGATDDPDQELIRVLGMEPRSVSARGRMIFDERLLALLFNVTAGFFFQNNPAINVAGKDERYWRQQWIETWNENQDTALQLLKHLAAAIGAPAPSLDNAALFHVFSWGDGWPFPDSLVSESAEDAGTLAEQCKNLVVNFPDSPASDSKSLLFELFWRSMTLEPKFFDTSSSSSRVKPAIWVDTGDPTYDKKSDRSLANASLNQEELEKFLRDALDLSTHRLDAWLSSFATKRLQAMRSAKPGGSYLGAYGWVEGLRMDTKSPDGFVHAPSVDQAKTAAILRSAYLTHVGEDGGNLARTDLSSRRLRNALELMRGIGPGQPVGALLGYQFERELHDRTLDAYVDSFRGIYPLVANSVTPIEPGESPEATAARNVVDGVALVSAWRSNQTKTLASFPPELAGAPPADARGLTAAMDALVDSLDALSDLALNESIYQSIKGRFEHAGAAMDALAGIGRPPEFESVKTPVEGVKYGNRVCLLFQSIATTADPLAPRVAAEPALHAWVAGILGNLAEIKCRVSYQTSADRNTWEGAVVSVQDIGLGALDFMYASSSTPRGEETEIEIRVASYVRGIKNLAADLALYMDFGRPPDGSRSMGEAMELARRTLALVGNASYLKPSNLTSAAQGQLPPPTISGAGPTTAADVSGFGEPDCTTLQNRVSNARARLADILGKLKTADDATNPTLAQLLHAGSLHGIEGLVPKVSTNAAELENLRETALQAMQKRLDECDARLAELGALAIARLGLRVDKLIEAMRALLGRSFIVLPAFQPANAPELQNALGKTGMLGTEGTERVTSWFQQITQVQSGAQRLETLMMLAEAWRSDAAATVTDCVPGLIVAGTAGPGTLCVMQLPFGANAVRLKKRVGGDWTEEPIAAQWMALSDSEWRDIYGSAGISASDRLERPRGIVSIVGLTPAAKVDFAAGPVAGLLVDSWDEQIPCDSIATGVSFHYNQPSAQAPQALLLAVPGDRDTTSSWTSDEVFEIVRDTMKLAKIRMVDLDAMQGVGRFLPAVFLARNVDMPVPQFVGTPEATLNTTPLLN